MKNSVFNILIATNDSSTVDTLLPVFSKKCFHSNTSRRASELLRTILDVEYDLLLLGLDISEISGQEILPIIRKMRPHLPVIVIFNDENFHEGSEISQYGVLCRFVKPLTNSDIDNILQVISKIRKN